MSEAAVDMINSPPHYAGTRWESIEIIEALGNQFRLGNALKYIFRHQKKNGVEDLKKARWYLERELAADAPTSRASPFNCRFFRENTKHFAESFGIDDVRLSNAISYTATACSDARLGDVADWRENVRLALAFLNAYLLGLEWPEGVE